MVTKPLKFFNLKDSPWPAFVSPLKTEHPRQRAFHSHEEGQLLFCQKGTIFTQTRDRITIIPPNRGIWWPPHVAHAASSQQSIFAQTLYVKSELCTASFFLKSHCLYLSALMREMLNYASQFDYSTTPTDAQHRFLLAIIDQIELQAIDYNELRIPTDPRLQKAQHYILYAEYEHNISLDNVAKISALSSRQLNRLIKDEFNLSFTQWKKELMIYRSIVLLEQSTSLADVAYACGFNSQANFSRVFKHIKGVTPKDYHASFSNKIL